MSGKPKRREYPHHFRPPDPADIKEVPVDASAQRGYHPRPPRPWYLQIAGQWPLFITLVGVTAGVAVTASSHWKRGTAIIGAVFVMATLLRVLLPEKYVGLLGVRSRLVDGLCLGLLGAGILILAILVPPTQK